MANLEETLQFFSNARFLRMLDTEGRKRLLDASEAKNTSAAIRSFAKGSPATRCTSSSAGWPR